MARLPSSQWSRRLLLWLAAGLLVTSVAGCGGDNDDPPPVTLSASLSGEQEVPPRSTGGFGTGTLTLHTPTFRVSGMISLQGVPANAAHVHIGDVGINGPIVIHLSETAPGSGIWTVPADATLNAEQAAAFGAGGLYYNAHSTEFPGGEVRGQIGRIVHGAVMNAMQEVPPTASAGSGVGWVGLDPASKRIVARMQLTGVTANAAHIHTGAAGVNGPIIVHLTQTTPGVWVSAADATLTDEQIALLNAGGLYFNAHSTALPGGEVRGQIGRHVSVTRLSGANEVPPNASLASGTGTLVVDPATRVASGGIVIAGMTATAAHIHTGAAGENGPIIIHLAAGNGGAWNVPTGTVLTPAQFKLLKQGNLYFNAHSAALPGGEIRGQLR